MFDVYEMGECEVHLRKGPLSKRLHVSPSSRCDHFLKYEPGKGASLCLGLRDEMAAYGWEIEAVEQTEGAKRAKAKLAKAAAK